MTRFFDQYKKICAERGISPNGAAKEIGLPSSSVTHWKDGAIPRIKTVQKIADYFGVTTDYLLGYTGIKEKPTLNESELDLNGLSAVKRDFINVVLDLNDDQVQALTALLEKFKAES